MIPFEALSDFKLDHSSAVVVLIANQERWVYKPPYQGGQGRINPVLLVECKTEEQVAAVTEQANRLKKRSA